MLIESDARRHITSAIELEKEIAGFEERERLKGKVVFCCDEYNKLRAKLVAKFGHINAVANMEGKGRDDLGVDILTEAENIIRRVSESQSRAVRRLAEDIKKSFANLRALLRKYETNIDAVDPQLKNNPELVEALVPFERAWERGKEFFLDRRAFGELLYLSQMIEGVAEKHREFRDKADSMDADVFFIIPCLVVLNSMEDSDKGISASYYPAIVASGTSEREHYMTTKSRYESLRRRRNDGYTLYNVFERAILEKPMEEQSMKQCEVAKKEVDHLVLEIKILAVGLQRSNPSSWNTLIETAMSQPIIIR